MTDTATETAMRRMALRANMTAAILNLIRLDMTQEQEAGSDIDNDG